MGQARELVHTVYEHIKYNKLVEIIFVVIDNKINTTGLKPSKKSNLFAACIRREIRTLV